MVVAGGQNLLNGTEPGLGYPGSPILECAVVALQPNIH